MRNTDRLKGHNFTIDIKRFSNLQVLFVCSSVLHMGGFKFWKLNLSGSTTFNIVSCINAGEHLILVEHEK